ncbi:transcriptional regulator PtsJ [Enterobacter sp. 638]|uniref:Transcriptional regulator, GntR family n=1 Tax=Enterobacter sp. (strain 638) TaxID=399742 RepID=A0A9J9L060_ENT38|nr:transcriptional regulator PtsJ [Enterobacter sp. 638]ABP62818.1 transcriptional regulator, GntR family [Enterobacter sp. 638]
MNINGKTAGDIFEQIRAMIQAGELVPGMMLPTLRELAGELGINRNTVALAYKRLTDAGFVISRGRNGTIVREHIMLTDIEGSASNLVLRDLASGNPAVTLLPSMSQLAVHIQNTPGLYGETVIRPELEALGLEWLKQDIGSPFDLNLTNGAVDAIEKVLTSYLIAGDRVAVEDPCFLSSISTLRHNRFQVAPVEIDVEGMKIESLSRQLSAGVKAVIITPRAHNPTGFSLSFKRAEGIRTLLASHPHVLVIVDDHFSLLSTHDYYHIVPGNTRNWVLIRSMSKSLGPDLRMAFVASDADTSQRLRLRLNSGTNWVSHILQDMVVGHMHSSGFQKSILSARESYFEKRELMVNALKQHGVKVPDHHDGLNVWIPLTQNSAPIVMQMAQRGWLIRGGEGFNLNNSGSGVRITISDLDATETKLIAKSLAEILTQ